MQILGRSVGADLKSSKMRFSLSHPVGSSREAALREQILGGVNVGARSPVRYDSLYPTQLGFSLQGGGAPLPAQILAGQCPGAELQ